MLMKQPATVPVLVMEKDTADDVALLLAAADAACYAAKDAGRNRVHALQPNDSQVQAQRGQMQWVARLNAALQADDSGVQITGPTDLGRLATLNRGNTNTDAVWVYREPKDAAKEIAGYVAFWRGVEVRAA
jgi:hypothetical protein